MFVKIVFSFNSTNNVLVYVHCSICFICLNKKCNFIKWHVKYIYIPLQCIWVKLFYKKIIIVPLRIYNTVKILKLQISRSNEVLDSERSDECIYSIKTFVLCLCLYTMYTITYWNNALIKFKTSGVVSGWKLNILSVL